MQLPAGSLWNRLPLLHQQTWKGKGLSGNLHKDAHKWNRTRETTELLGIILNFGKNLYNDSHLQKASAPLTNNSHWSVLETWLFLEKSAKDNGQLKSWPLARILALSITLESAEKITGQACQENKPRVIRIPNDSPRLAVCANRALPSPMCLSKGWVNYFYPTWIQRSKLPSLSLLLWQVPCDSK